MSYTVTLPIRKVIAVAAPKDKKRKYRVYEQKADGTWDFASKYYDHSTSAFAALGRLTQKDTEQLLTHQEGKS